MKIFSKKIAKSTTSILTLSLVCALFISLTAGASPFEPSESSEVPFSRGSNNTSSYHSDVYSMFTDQHTMTAHYSSCSYNPDIHELTPFYSSHSSSNTSSEFVCSIIDIQSIFTNNHAVSYDISARDFTPDTTSLQHIFAFQDSVENFSSFNDETISSQINTNSSDTSDDQDCTYTDEDPDLILSNL